jgi:transcriptional regulator GlxA family with amidase domain
VPSTDAIRVAIVAYDGVSLLDLSGPLEALRVASTHPNHLGASLKYACSVHSVHGGLVMTADGVRIMTEPVSVASARNSPRNHPGLSSADHHHSAPQLFRTSTQRVTRPRERVARRTARAHSHRVSLCK